MAMWALWRPHGLFNIICILMVNSIRLQLTCRSGLHVPPAGLSRQRPVKRHRAGSRTVTGAAAAVPAFLRVQDDRWPSFFRIRDKNVDRTYLHALIAPDTGIRINYHRHTGGLNIGNRKYFLLRHRFSSILKFIYLACIRRYNPCYAPRTAASCLPRSAAEARRTVSGH